MAISAKIGFVKVEVTWNSQAERREVRVEWRVEIWVVMEPGELELEVELEVELELEVEERRVGRLRRGVDPSVARRVAWAALACDWRVWTECECEWEWECEYIPSI